MFELDDWRSAQKLIADYPLAWVCARLDGEASQLPLIASCDAEGRPVELIGHFARSNPIGAALAADPRATILFSGPQGYVSPAHAGRRDWGPTWNYAQLRIAAEITIDPDLTEAALGLLIDHMERNRAEPWAASELGNRYPGMLARIVGFRAKVVGLSGKFKLGQDENPATLRTILASHEDPALTEWMRHANRERLKDNTDA